MTITANLYDFYMFNAKISFKNMIIGIDFFRCLEYPLVLSNFDAKKGHKVLDIGSRNSIFPLFLASKECQVYATDIDDRVFKQIQLANNIGLEKTNPDTFKNFKVEIEDATNLSYPDNFFDRITAISTLEHIKGDGDIRAMKEIARVLSINGLVVITVPFRRIYEENGKDIKGYEDTSFFERRYNEAAIVDRLIKPSGLSIKKIQYFGERNFQYSNLLTRRYIKILLHPFTPIFSRVFINIADKKDYDNLKENELGNLNKNSGGVCITLEKKLLN